MPLERLRFEVDGDVQYSRAFEALSTGSRNMRRPLERIGESLLRAVGRQFESEGSAGGRPWAQLSPAYAKWKAKRYPGRPILVLTGEMREAATARRAISVEARRLVYEVDSWKAPRHQRGQGRLPQRRIVDIGSGERRAWDRIVHEWLIEIRRGPIGTTR